MLQTSTADESTGLIREGDPLASLSTVRGSSRRNRIAFLCIVVIGLISLGFVWVRSWTHMDNHWIDLRFVKARLLLAGSSGAVTLSRENASCRCLGIGGNVDMSTKTGRAIWEVNWVTGEPIGTTTESSPWMTPLHTPVALRFDRVGSFAAARIAPSGLASAPAYHLRIPIWLVALLLVAWWFWVERRIRQRRAA